MKNNIILNNQKQLEAFLKLVAQESVKKTLRESDQHVEMYKQQKAVDSSNFKSLKEENEENEENDMTSDLQPTSQEKIEKETELADDEDVIDQITPRMIVSKINNIRAGLSLKNKEVKDNLVMFLEKLDDNELLVLFYYLGDIAKILNQKIKGQDATDPSEDPLNISMTRQSSEKSTDGQQQQQRVKEKIPAPKQKEEEDTSPPIKVNESQNKEDIRRKIRILMS